ncbi:unnamed protein product [Leptosia nina]|uniref:FLYWCH-type domain-containing protein n=1 Tax=Leptosia nina TaxID=320188 RepID=A0AAV1J5I6_9NEOP
MVTPRSAGGITSSRRSCPDDSKRGGSAVPGKATEPKFGLSQRGNLVVQIGEWRFNKHACWGSKVRWTCIKKKSGCNAAITTVDNVIVKTLGAHNH